MEQRIHQLQSQIQLMTILQHSITETITDMSEDLGEPTINNLSRSFMCLEGEKLRKEREISRLKKL